MSMRENERSESREKKTNMKNTHSRKIETISNISITTTCYTIFVFCHFKLQTTVIICNFSNRKFHIGIFIQLVSCVSMVDVPVHVN